MTEIAGKTIWVAGHRGMVGSAIVRRLAQERDVRIVTASSSEVDLRDPAATRAFVHAHRPDLVFMAAARVGGILANSERPVDFLQDNLAIAISTIAAAHEAGVEKFMFLGSSCIYPKLAAQPIREDALLTGPLEPTNQWYAVAKISGIMLCDAYRQQYGADFISAMPTNLYGPGDNYDLTSSHVLPATIRKIAEAVRAQAGEVSIWGTGTPMREFMHADDLADALVFLMRHFSGPGPVNVGTGEEISILGLHEMVADVMGWRGRFVFDGSKPDGTPRKLMDSSRLAAMGWKPAIPLRTGVEAVVGQWLSDQPPHQGAEQLTLPAD